MVSEVITLEGHIVDSRALSEVMDDIIAYEGDFEILEVHIGQRRLDRSHARIEVHAQSAEQLTKILAQISRHGALVVEEEDAVLAPADLDGTFPAEFYPTTNQPTFVRHQGQWVEVRDQELGCGIRQDPSDGFRCVPIEGVRKGDQIVCGYRGIKIESIDRLLQKGTFQFMAEEVSMERPKSAIIRQCALEILAARDRGAQMMLVGGPAIVHTDSARHIVRLVELGLLSKLVAGNALAIHDIEVDLFGTSRGVYMERATLADTGHEHPVRAINEIRRAGGIRAAVEQGILNGGILHACVTHDVDYLLVGDVDDDGFFAETITDSIEAQCEIRKRVRNVGFLATVASSTLGVACGYLVPASVPVACVDINPIVLEKIRERGPTQTVGIVTDAEPFLRELVRNLEALTGQESPPEAG